MAAALDFYFDYSSPYGYFAAMKIDELAARHGREVNWKPILLGVVFKVTGGQPLPSLPLKGAYALCDIARSARFYGIPYQHPAKFPIASQAPARAFYWLNERDSTLAKKLAQALLKCYGDKDRRNELKDRFTTIHCSLRQNSAERIREALEPYLI